MNRLKHSRCYLAGCMENATDLGVSWRIKIQQELSDLGIVWLDPTQKPSVQHVEDENTIKLLNQLRSESDYDSVSEVMKPIRSIDLRLVDISDFLVVHLDKTILTHGTYEEIFLANRSKKPIIVHHEQGKNQIGLWFFGALLHEMFFETWDEVYTYIRHIAIDSNINSLGRWKFFDFNLCRKVKNG